jgi:hypothetical protein
MKNFICNSDGRDKQFEINCLKVQTGHRRIKLRCTAVRVGGG